MGLLYDVSGAWQPIGELIVSRSSLELSPK